MKGRCLRRKNMRDIDKVALDGAVLHEVEDPRQNQPGEHLIPAGRAAEAQLLIPARQGIVQMSHPRGTTSSIGPTSRGNDDLRCTSPVSRSM